MRLALVVILAGVSAAHADDRGDVLQTYVRIAAATYGDTADAGAALRRAVAALTADPSEAALAAARDAWRTARRSYMQTEAFRFGNPVVDAWEPRVNSWPLDEGLIDYVDPSYGGASDENPDAALNVIATPRFTLGATEVDATTITPALIADTLQEADGVDTNVAAGWHAVEFLLWGQDLHGTGPGAGQRPWTDYATGDACTHGNCDRRAAYLTAVTDLLAGDLRTMADDWSEGGAARGYITDDPQRGLAAALTGLGTLSLGEMAGERINLGLLLHDPEEEQDCFSDNTANSAYWDGVGIRNVYLGSYTAANGATVSGPSPSTLVAAADPSVDAGIRDDIAATMDRLAAIKAAADGGMAWDQMLAADNPDGNSLLQAAVDALTEQAKGIERAITALGLTGVSPPQR